MVTLTSHHTLCQHHRFWSLVSIHHSVSQTLQFLHTVELPEPGMNKTYPCSCLPDHHGDQFQQERAQVVQFDVRDIDNNLVLLWRFNDVFAPGTIFLMAIIFWLWQMPPGKNSTRTPFVRENTSIFPSHGSF